MEMCQDCVHFEVCRDYIKSVLDNFDESRMSAEGCEFFQERARFVEVPQALHLGDMVHFVLRDLDEIDLKEYSFTVGNCAVSDTVQFITAISTSGFWVGESPREFFETDEFYHWYELGNTVFLIREEAEKALREREA